MLNIARCSRVRIRCWQVPVRAIWLLAERNDFEGCGTLHCLYPCLTLATQSERRHFFTSAVPSLFLPDLPSQLSGELTYPLIDPTHNLPRVFTRMDFQLEVPYCYSCFFHTINRLCFHPLISACICSHWPCQPSVSYALRPYPIVFSILSLVSVYPLLLTIPLIAHSLLPMCETLKFQMLDTWPIIDIFRSSLRDAQQ